LRSRLVSSPLPTAAQWPAISRLLDDVLALAPADRAPWLDRLATVDTAHHLTLRELLATLERVEEDDFLTELPRLDVEKAPPFRGADRGGGGAPLIFMLHCNMLRLELLHRTINWRPP
jgi:hypothetical protein